MTETQRKARAELARRELLRRAPTDTLAFCLAYKPTVAHPQRGMVAFNPYIYQRDILKGLDAGGPVVCLKARQIGISTTVMVQKLRRCIQPGTTVLTISRTQAMAQELIRIARDAAKGCDPEFPVALARDNAQQLVFANGSRIIADSASPNTGRGYAASDVVFDEFAALTWQEEMWSAVYPTVSRGGNVAVVSTPAMEGDLFHQHWLRGSADDSPWRAYRADWRDCPEYVASDDWYTATRPAFSESAWLMEYECEFGHAADAVFASRYIERASELALTPAETHKPRYIMGGDLAGEGRDESVLLVLDIGCNPARIVCLRSWEQLPAPMLQAEVERMADEFGCDPWLDRTGIGWGIVENLRRPAVGLAITGGNAVSGKPRAPNVPRTLLVNNLVLALEQEQIAIQREHQELVMGLRSYRWDKRKGTRADHVDALAIAWWAAVKSNVQSGIGLYDYSKDV